jgi:hypothetical protein
MDWKKLARQANRVIQKRGGPESVKEDAQELEGIAKEKGTLGDKLKAAAQAIKEPGAPHGHAAAAQTGPQAGRPAATEPGPAPSPPPADPDLPTPPSGAEAPGTRAPGTGGSGMDTPGTEAPPGTETTGP